jgi:hypothetical protein
VCVCGLDGSRGCVCVPAGSGSGRRWRCPRHPAHAIQRAGAAAPCPAACVHL